MCLKFTHQNAGKCSSGYLSKQYFPKLYGAHAFGVQICSL